MSSKSKNKGFTRIPKTWVGGFTVVELIVVIGIATAIMTALVIQQDKWNDSLTVTTEGYEMALMIRQAQIYSLGVRENLGGTGDKFDVGYGVFFGKLNSDTDPTIWKKRYILFADVDKNGVYEPAIDRVVETKILTRGVFMDRFCGVKGTGQEVDRCSPGTGNVAYMHLTFLRPDPKARVVLWNTGGNTSVNVLPPAKIFLESPKGKCFYVIVEENGQISSGLTTNASECRVLP